MITGPTAPNVAAIGQYLDAVAAALADQGIGCHVTRPAETPVLTTTPLAGPDAATVALDPDMHAGSRLRLDCTCVWTTTLGVTPLATAAVIAAVLSATHLGNTGTVGQPVSADVARLAAFLRHHPGWSVFWDPRYGLWRAAEDDPASVIYVEALDVDVVMTYIANGGN